MAKTKNFENFFKCFSQLDVSLARESWNLLSKLATGLTTGMTHESESPKGKVENFWILKFFKTQTISKTNYKKLKNLFMFDKHMIEYVQHF